MPDFPPQQPMTSECLPTEYGKPNYLFIRYDNYRGVEDLVRGKVNKDKSFHTVNGNSKWVKEIGSNTRLVISLSGINEICKLEPYLNIIESSQFQTIIINNLANREFATRLFETFPTLEHKCQIIPLNELSELF